MPPVAPAAIYPEQWIKPPTPEDIARIASAYQAMVDTVDDPDDNLNPGGPESGKRELVTT